MNKLILGLLLASSLLFAQNPPYPVTANRITKGTGVPSTGCSVTADRGKVYVRSDAAAASSSLYACVNTTGSTTAWELAQTAGGATAVTLPTPGATCTLVAPSTICVATTTATITVPVPAAGYQFCVLNDDNVSTVITLSAIGSSARYENTARTSYGTAGTGTLVSGGAIGDAVCIVGRDSTHYLTVSYTGTWTAN